MAHLELPSERWQSSFLQAMSEFQREDRYADLDLAELRRAFPEFVARVTGFSRGQGSPEGYVPSTDYWLIDGEEFIGIVSIRHQMTGWLLKAGGLIGYSIRPSKRRMGYGTLILALVLPKAREFGFTRVLVTCDETNIGSKKIIEANGGVLENVVEIGTGQPRKLRYWIELSDEPDSLSPGR